MIKSLNFQLLSSNLLLTFVKYLLALVQRFNIAESPLKPFIDACQHTYTNFAQALEGDEKNPYTALVMEDDNLRDNMFLGFRTFVKSYIYHPDEAMAAAARKLMEVIRLYGYSAHRMGYKAETAALSRLIADIVANYMAEITLLGADAWFTLLQQAQDKFEGTRQAAINADAEVDLNLAETRPPMVESVRNLLSMLSLQVTVLNNQEMKSLVLELNENITNTMSTARASATRKANSNAEEDVTEG
jgi:hypothetical protein